MSISNKIIHKSKSLSFQRDNNIAVSSYPHDDYFKQNNDSNNTIIRKSSFKHKIFSIFKSHSKPSYTTENHTIDNNARCSLTRDSSQVDSSRSTLSNDPKLRIVTVAQSQLMIDYRDRIDNRDRQLLDQLSLHSLTQSILDCILEQPCKTIKLPSSWITNVDTNITNRAIQPFLTSIPGKLGLKNHGNTCYVNVIVQCLAHLDFVAEYFSTKDYLADIIDLSAKNNDQMEFKNTASSLDVLVGFSYLLQSLWQQTYTAKISIKFCQLLTLHKNQFSIDSQQDAHELLLCILNLLHDNLVRPSSQSTEESSFIYDRFRGWLSNEITCPRCRHSRKFSDQMLSLNLPIRKDNYDCDELLNISVFCIIVINGNQTAEKHAFEINKSTSVFNIRANIAERLDCQSCDVVVLQLVESGFGKLYSDDDVIKDISQKNNYLSSNAYDNFENGIYAVYIPNQVVDVDALPFDSGSTDAICNSMKRTKDVLETQPFIRLLVVHVEKTKDYISEIGEELQRNLYIDPQTRTSSTFTQKHFHRFTNVLTVQAARKTKLALLRHSLSEQMCKHLNLRNITKLPKPQFLIEGSHLISELDTFPLSQHSVTMALQQSAKVYGEESAVVRLVVVWPFGTIRMLKFNRRIPRDGIHGSNSSILNFQKILLHQSVEELSVKQSNITLNNMNSKPKLEQQITLKDCLREFFGLDSLSVTESWNCPNCETTQQAHTNIRIKQAPEILILMLKRFTKGKTLNINYANIMKNDSMQNNFSRNQQNNNIKKDNSTKKGGTNKADNYLNKLDCFVDYPLENLNIKEYMENTEENESYLYNLVGVVNHRGNLSNGHYMAMCHNSIDNQWRMYDDDRVTEISKLKVVHPDAYILFYKRQSVSPKLNSGLNLHWSYRRLSFPIKIHRNQSPNPTSLYSTHRRYSEKEPLFKSIDSYGTLPLRVSNNHNSWHSLNSHLDTITEMNISRKSILSPHLSISSNSSLTKCPSVPLSSTSLIDQETNFIDLTTITSKIVDVDSYSARNGYPLERNISNGSSDSAQDDSGVVLSQLSSSPPSRYRNDLDLSGHGREDCYSFLSTSPSNSSPIVSKKITHVSQFSNLPTNNLKTLKKCPSEFQSN